MACKFIASDVAVGFRDIAACTFDWISNLLLRKSECDIDETFNFKKGNCHKFFDVFEGINVQLVEVYINS